MVGWIDNELASVAETIGSVQLDLMREALLAPLRHVYGVSDKVLSIALSVLLMAAPRSKRHWADVNANMIAINTAPEFCKG